MNGRSCCTASAPCTSPVTITGDGRGAHQADDSLLPPCIITFGGSALRMGGGYAESVLHILEDAPAESNNKDKDSNRHNGDADESHFAVKERGEGLGHPSMSKLFGFIDPLGSRKSSLSRFQT